MAVLTKEESLTNALKAILEIAKTVSFKPEDHYSLNGPVPALGRIQGRAEYVLSLWSSNTIEPPEDLL